MGGLEAALGSRCVPAAARLGVHGSHPGRGVQRKAGGGHPAGATLPALWPGGALHQRHRQRRGPEDTVSAASALTPHFPEVWPGDGLGVGWGWSWAKLGGLGIRSLLQNTSQHREGADKETI